MPASLPAESGAVTITFSEFPPGTIITTQYRNLGIVFAGNTPGDTQFITTDGANPTSPELSGTPIFEGNVGGHFVSPTTTTSATVTSLSLDVGYITDPGSTVLEAFSSTGALIATVAAESVGWNLLTVTAPGIASFLVTTVSFEPFGFGVDNVSFVPPAPSKYMLAFGDSIAAGYGLGPSGPKTGGSATNNPYTYSAILAKQFSLADHNYAIEGTTATGVLKQICESLGTTSRGTACTHPVVPARAPQFITLTVGADDVTFVGCMTSALEGTDSNPCTPMKLQRKLSSYGKHLQRDLVLLHEYYRASPVFVTGYYDPLGSNPQTHFLLPPTCPLVEAGVVAPMVLHKEWRSLQAYVESLYLKGNNSANIDYDAFISAFARMVVTSLNSTISSVASHDSWVTYVPLSIGTRGLCSPTPLIFEPEAKAYIALVSHVFIFTTILATLTLTFGYQHTCPGPKDPTESKYTINKSGYVTLFTKFHLAGLQVTYHVTVNVNCVPHPTMAGQTSLAGQLRPYVVAKVGA
jgi:hypothetical protein